jgi:hypothetical protein
MGSTSIAFSFPLILEMVDRITSASGSFPLAGGDPGLAFLNDFGFDKLGSRPSFDLASVRMKDLISEAVAIRSYEGPHV